MGVHFTVAKRWDITTRIDFPSIQEPTVSHGMSNGTVPCVPKAGDPHVMGLSYLGLSCSLYVGSSAFLSLLIFSDENFHKYSVTRVFHNY